MNNYGAECYFNETVFMHELEKMMSARMRADPVDVMRKIWAKPFENGATPEIPPRVFPTLEKWGNRIGVFPAWDGAGNFTGWQIQFENRFKRPMACVNNALQYAVQSHETFMHWHGLAPVEDVQGRAVSTDRVALLTLCPVDCVKRFIEQACRNGFSIAARKRGAGVSKDVPEFVEMDGVRVEFVPRLSYAGAIIGWSIVFCNPMHREIEMVDQILKRVFPDKNTEWRWRELNPGAYGYGNATIARGCSTREVERFFAHARKAGFYPIFDWMDETKGN